jgi:hypothetical protein
MKGMGELSLQAHLAVAVATKLVLVLAPNPDTFCAAFAPMVHASQQGPNTSACSACCTMFLVQYQCIGEQWQHIHHL